MIITKNEPKAERLAAESSRHYAIGPGESAWFVGDEKHLRTLGLTPIAPRAYVEVRLSPSGVPPEDYEAWGTYVAERIEAACEVHADVLINSYPRPCDFIRATNPEARQRVKEWLRVAWEDFCQGSPA